MLNKICKISQWKFSSLILSMCIIWGLSAIISGIIDTSNLLYEMANTQQTNPIMIMIEMIIIYAISTSIVITLGHLWLKHNRNTTPKQYNLIQYANITTIICSLLVAFSVFGINLYF